MIKFTPLFSGSKGNCSLVQSDETNILLDVGYGYKATVGRLALSGLFPKDIDTIVITHEHADHIAALPMWTKYNPDVKIYAPSPLMDLICKKSYSPNVQAIDGEFDAKTLHVIPYCCSHDAICCYGYKFSDGVTSVACVTDTGIATDQTIKFLSDCKIVQIESNHDVNMLLKGEYSYPLKRRILSDFGHLSNEQAAELLTKLVGTSVKIVVLAHLSEKNNTKELAFNQTVSAYARLGLVEGRDVTVYCADQYHNEVTFE